MPRPYVLANPRRSSPEKQEERAARRLMCEALGFTAWHLSQARATQQTPGWPDLLFMDPAKGIAVWYEAKAPKGKQSDAQREFQREALACGYAYVVGPCSALLEWCERMGLCRALPSGGIVVTRNTSVVARNSPEATE